MLTKFVVLSNIFFNGVPVMPNKMSDEALEYFDTTGYFNQNSTEPTDAIPTLGMLQYINYMYTDLS